MTSWLQGRPSRFRERGPDHQSAPLQSSISPPAGGGARRRARNLLRAGLAVVTCGVLAALIMGIPSPKPPAAAPSASHAGPAPTRAPHPVDAGSRHVRTYALAASDLSGLPGDVSPGTRIDLWVAWDPPVTKGPSVQRLLTDLTIAEVAPGVGASSPSVIVNVPEEDVERLLYGDRYGALSATMIP